MNANLAKRLSIQNQKNNEELQDYIKYTEDEIKKAINNGKRQAVMYRTASLNETLIKYWEEQGFVVKQLYPTQLTLYVTW